MKQKQLLSKTTLPWMSVLTTNLTSWDCYNMQISQGFASSETDKPNFSKFLGPVAAREALGNPHLDVSEFNEQALQPVESQATAARLLLDISIAHESATQFQIQVAILEIK